MAVIPERVWKEDVVFAEKGSRIWHSILLDRVRNSLLVVVATEKSDRHIEYSVSADFLRAFGCTWAANTEMKWKSREGAVKWLISLAAIDYPIFPFSSHRVTGKKPSLECIKSLMAHLSSRKNITDDEGSQKSTSEIIWSGEAWICNKQFKHYPSFCRRGVNIDTYSFVFVIGGKEVYLAYVQDMYEDQNHMKMVRVRRFSFRNDIEDLLGIDTHAREVFITPHSQDIRAEWVRQPATVLTPTHFEICLNFIPESVHPETFLCHRQVKTNKIEGFYLSQLHGYSSQPVVSCLMSNQQYLEYIDAGGAKPVQEPPRLTFNKNDKVELLSQDSGLRGCWFKCTILRMSQKLLRVQYCDVFDDEYESLKAYVLSNRVADPDELGMRHAGRLTVRPQPSSRQTVLTELNVGSAVDAWWCNGWWEGIFVGHVASSVRNLRVFLLGEKKFLTVERKNLRASKEWIDGRVSNRWTSIKPNPNILASIDSILNPIPQLSQPPVWTGTNNSAPGNSNSINQRQEPHDVPESFSTAVRPEAAGELNYKRVIIQYEYDRNHKKSKP